MPKYICTPKDRKRVKIACKARSLAIKMGLVTRYDNRIVSCSAKRAKDVTYESLTIRIRLPKEEKIKKVKIQKRILKPPSEKYKGRIRYGSRSKNMALS